MNLGLHLVRDEINSLSTVWHDVWSGLSSAVQTVWTVIHPILSAISSALGSVASAAKTVSGALGAVTGAPGKLISGVSKYFNSGGVVPGSGDSDTVPAMLTPGEYVITKTTAQALGYDYLDAMNNGAMRAYATGGRVTKHPVPAGAGRLAETAGAPKKQYEGVKIRVAAVRTTSQTALQQQATAYGASLKQGKYTSDATYATEVGKRTTSNLSELERKAMVPLQRSISALGKDLTKDKTAEKHGTLTSSELGGLTKQLELDKTLAAEFVKNTRGLKAHTEALDKLRVITADLTKAQQLAQTKAAATGMDAGTVIARAEAASSGKAGTAHNGFGINNNAYATLLSERGAPTGAAIAKTLATETKKATAVTKKAIDIGTSVGKGMAAEGKKQTHATGVIGNLTKAGHTISRTGNEISKKGVAVHQDHLKVSTSSHAVGVSHLAVGKAHHETSQGHRSDQQKQHAELMGANKKILAAHADLQKAVGDLVRALSSEIVDLNVDGDKIAGVVSRKQLAKLKAR